MNGLDRLLDFLPRSFFVVPIFVFAIILVFIVMAGIVALRRRESLFDVMDFAGIVLFRKARVWALVLIALAFLL